MSVATSSQQRLIKKCSQQGLVMHEMENMLKLSSGVLTCKRIKPYGVPFTRLKWTVLGPHARNMDARNNIMATQLKG